MKLLINCSTIGNNPTGLGVYSTKCALGISKRISSTAISSENMGSLRIEIGSPRYITIGSGRFSALLRLLWSLFVKIRNDRFIYNPTHHGIFGHNNQVITIHDLICLKFPGQHVPQYLYFNYILPRYIKQYRAIFTVSESTRNEISARYNYPKENIFIVPNSINKIQFKEEAKFTEEGRFLLMVGARYSHKNVEEVLNNSDLWSDDYQLVVTSCQGKYKKRLEALLKKRRLQSNVMLHGYLSNIELGKLYHSCSALLYPSKWEGFGIPPLEALVCGAPLIVSNIPAHQEVLGDAAIFVDLGNKDSWKKAFEQLKNKDIIKNKTEYAKKIIDKYSLENALTALEISLLQVEPRLERVREL